MTNKIKTIPKEWKEIKLGDACDFINGKTPLRSKKEYWENGTVPWFTINDVRKQGRIINKTSQCVTELALKESGLKIVPRNNVLLCCTASIGEYAFTKIDLTTNQQFNALVIKDDKAITSEFLFSISPLFKKKLEMLMGTTTFGFINLEKLGSIKILLPPLPEQNKIAEILLTIDEDIEKTEGIIKKTEELKKGLMQKLLTKGVNAKINSVCKINPKQINPKKSPDQKFSYIDIASVKDYRVNEIKIFLGKDAPSRARREIIENDIIISTVRPNLRGFTFITDLFNHFLCSTGFCVLRCEKKIYSKYLYYIVLQDKFVRYLVDKTTGSNYPAVNSNIVGEYIFKLPSMNEQKQITEILSAVDDKIDINKQTKNKLTLLKKGLMQDLLSGRVRV